jgi:hypothetical protein
VVFIRVEAGISFVLEMVRFVLRVRNPALQVRTGSSYCAVPCTVTSRMKAPLDLCRCAARSRTSSPSYPAKRLMMACPSPDHPVAPPQRRMKPLVLCADVTLCAS